MCLIEDQSWIDCIDITSRWDTFVLYHLYGNKGVSLPLWPIRPRWFHTFCPCAEPLGDGYEGMWARFGSQGSIALNWHSRYSGTRYSGTWLYLSPTNRVGGGHRNGIVHESIYNTRGFCAFATNADKPLIGLSSNLAGEFIILDSWGLINFGTCSAEFLPFPGLWFVKQFLCICGQSHIDWAQIGWVSSSWTSPGLGRGLLKLHSLISPQAKF